MKYAIYGISCCGKDTLINNLLDSNNFLGYTHPEGSKSLNNISLKIYGRLFKEISSRSQKDIRDKYAEILDKERNIFSDGHYCFPGKNHYDIVFTEKDAKCYDAFFYLKTNPEEIKKRISNSNKNQQYANLTISDLAIWQQKEINDLQDICFNINKDFIIFDNDFNNTLNFIDKYNKNYRIINSRQQAIRLANKCKTISKENKKIALFDCDRTIIAEDSGTIFFNANNASLNSVKEIFKDDCYTQYQFWKYHNLYKNFTEHPSIFQYSINPIIEESIKKLRKEQFFIIGITSGIGEIWRQINKRQKLVDLMISSTPHLIISNFTKGFLAKFLSKDCEVFACGDSLADIYMLESANNGIIFAPGKLRPSIQEYLDSHPKTNIKQFKQNPNQYQNIEAI